MIAGLVLAAGRSRRMGGRDKAFVPLGGVPLVARAAARLRPQVTLFAISANTAPEELPVSGMPVIADPLPRFQGPLAGMLAGLRWGRDAAGVSHLATVAVDTPFFPADFVARLAAAAGEGAAVARSGGRIHPTFALLPVTVAGDLADFLATDPSRRAGAWLARHDPAVVDFALSEAGDPFFNVNTPADLAVAEARLAACASAGLGES